ncbi:4374_t:CDS:2 [Ambispora gerdemannii]|uniref:4374_t:CDS:1 n=1 Tax=Ambispora gerdemannii TaxID=144530 RepID=A0A9N9BR30_9GLOM|nr:4374_t:CDS:2 [Ambispora gerdemannii]
MTIEKLNVQKQLLILFGQSITIFHCKNNFQIQIAKKLEKLETKVSLTADIWTSVSNQAYLEIRTKEKFLQLLDEMNLNEKILALTTDNDSKMILCEKLITHKLDIEWNNCEFQHYYCAAHVLNIAITHGMELSVGIINKVRTFVTKIRNSTILCDILRSYCQVIKKNYIKPELDVITRWNSTYQMLEKFKIMRKELNFLVASNKNLASLYFEDTEWNDIDPIIELLEPMFKATKILSLSTYPTMKEECMMAESIRKKLADYWNLLMILQQFLLYWIHAQNYLLLQMEKKAT